MTITIAWWWIPIALVIAGIVGFLTLGRERGDYDFFHPLLGLGCLIFGIGAAAAFLLGRLFA